MTHEQLLYLLHGAYGTVVLSVLTFVFASAAGLAVALMRVSANTMVRSAAFGYINIIQGTPLLVLMGVCFYGPTIVGYSAVPPMVAAVLALTIQSAAFLGEIWRGCIQAVPQSQWEAAECLGLNRVQRMFKVILPQAVRIATPPTVGFMVQIVKNTSLASVVGFVELAEGEWEASMNAYYDWDFASPVERFDNPTDAMEWCSTWCYCPEVGQGTYGG